jgi:multicomponent Na+:H+ antiporter subunit E
MNLRRTTFVQFLILLAFWFALSGRWEPTFVAIGALSCGLITLLTHRIAGTTLRYDIDHLPVTRLPRAIARAAAFAAWMAGRIFLSSLQLAVIAVSPRMPLEPSVVRFRTDLRSPMARTVLANSISLVPGTLTVDVVDEVVTVHALAPNQVDELVSGRLQNKVAGLFLDDPQASVDPATIERSPETIDRAPE